MEHRGSVIARAAPFALLALIGCIPDSARPPQAGTSPVAEVPAPPAAPPAWEARPVSADAQDVSATIYVVVAGDNVRAIGARTGAGSEAIARANGLQPPFIIRPGQRLAIPAGRYHRVRAGESGIAIARAYGIEWSRIVAANGLEDPFILRVDQRVLVPGLPATPQSAAQRAAAFTLDVDDILTGGEPALAADDTAARPVATATRVLPPTAAIAEPPRLAGGFTWPVRGAIVKRFGPGASGEVNEGIKIAVPLGTPVLAAADGVVAYAGSGIAALGGLVLLKHGDGLTTAYGHAGQLLVQRGQSVKRGQSVALSGDSGFAEQPQLHFELRRGRTPVDPLTRLPRL